MIMGIDIYASWRGQTKKEAKAQITGFSVVHGHGGYLREAYHGGPYATEFLVAEAFEDRGGVQIPAAVLRERLPQALELVKERYAKLYEMRGDEIADVLDSFTKFVELCERKERETGEPVTIVASW